MAKKRKYAVRAERKGISVRDCVWNEKKRPGKKGRVREYEKGR
jgi:hypothetical protein